MRRLLAAVISCVVLAGCSSGSQLQNGDQTGFVSADGSAVVKNAAERGEPVELIANEIKSNNPWKLSEHRGDVVLLNAWGPWCAPCRKELPELQKIATQLEPKGLKIVGLATRTNATSTLAFTEKFNITYPQLADYDSAALSQLPGIPSATVPGTIFIDRNGRIAGWALGAADPALIRSIAESLLDESAS
ncbi:MAG: hypothetical protein RIS43_298 [Actinomycetota bacterium]|jgi:thiol-disulfide isomerase/thioredoxin